MTQPVDDVPPPEKTVLVERTDAIAWISLNRPDKRNAMNPAMAYEMLEILDTLEADESCGVVVLSGAGDSFSSGMDIKEYFRESDRLTTAERMRVYRTSSMWQWRLLLHYAKPTIAMVNGWCFGGAFTPLIACDLAIAADDAVFGLSEINWGIIPAGVVSKAVAEVMSRRDALYYIMTVETFDGKEAKAMGLVNMSVPRAELRARTEALARKLLEKNPATLRQAKTAFKYASEMSWDTAADYLRAKADQLKFIDPERGRDKGMKQFLDDKTYRPGLGSYEREP
jgi:trans-feruloyl-CoA hydratase/vanillin synthase